MIIMAPEGEIPRFSFRIFLILVEKISLVGEEEETFSGNLPKQTRFSLGIL